MDYREYAPPAELAPFVRCFWTLAGTPHSDSPERILPDGRTELVIQLGEAFDRVDSPGRRERQPRALFVGQLDRRVLLQPTGAGSTFGICFHPDGASAFAPWTQQETAGRILALDEVYGGEARRLEDAVRNAADHGARVGIATGFLRGRMRAARIDRRVRAAVESIQREPWRRMASIAEDAGCTTRHLERAFLERVGCTPKTLACITRFQRVLALRDARPAWSWARVAVEAGYFDQAHLIGDFRRFSGSTPALLAEDFTEMERLFVRTRR